MILSLREFSLVLAGAIAYHLYLYVFTVRLFRVAEARGMVEERDTLCAQELETCKWKLDMCKIRSGRGLRGPISKNCLTASYIWDLSIHGSIKVIGGVRPVPRAPSVQMSTTANQVGQFVKDTMHFDGFRPRWTLALWRHYGEELKRGRSISVPAYPHSAEDMALAMRNTPPLVEGKGDVAVVGSISPWLESVVYHTANFATLVNIAYDGTNEPINEIPALETTHFVALKEEPRRFDVMISFSSLEHDGLGRYGDVLDPDGDLCAMHEIWMLLKEEGYFLLGIPTAQRDLAFFSNHRIYGPLRLKRMLRGFTMLGYVWDGVYAEARGNTMNGQDRRLFAPGENDWKHQPVLVLRRLKGYS